MYKAVFIFLLLLLPMASNKAKAALNFNYMASFDSYINTPLRKALTSSANNGTKDTPGHPRADDAGNWTGCSNGTGNLVGTYRDISACFLSQELGRPATYEDLKALTEQDAKRLIKKRFWDKLELDKVSHQETANIICHIYMHYGNIKVVQRALNKLGAGLSTDGQPGPKTNAALQKYAGVTGYNAIRSELKTAYENNSVVIYRKPFLDALEKHFPIISDNKALFFFHLDSSNFNSNGFTTVEIPKNKATFVNNPEQFKTELLTLLKKYQS